MAMSTAAAPMTVEEFLKLPDVEGHQLELIRGEVVDTLMGTAGPKHEIVKARLMAIFQNWLRDHSSGMLFAESMFYLDDENTLIPDVSFLSADRVERGPEEMFQGAPDLAVEVVSKSEPAARLLDKIELYLSHGAKLVLVVYPSQRYVEARTASQVRTLKHDQVLEDTDVLPGFSTPISAIFEGL